MTPNQTITKDSASFRDPSGFVFSLDGNIYRQINLPYKEDYEFFMGSSLYQRLVSKQLLIPHMEIDAPIALTSDAYRCIQVEPIQFISYPYEWTFSQLKDAALLTLQIQKEALQCGMVLKDASSYNVQFHHGKPIFIDTLSFSKQSEGKPWIAYRQFCQHFIAPLAMMHYKDIRMAKLLISHLDGIPLDLASASIPSRSTWNTGILMHLHLHAKSQKHFSADSSLTKRRNLAFNKAAFEGLIDSLERTVIGLTWEPDHSKWSNYYEATNYLPEAFTAKAEKVRSLLHKVSPQTILDIGSNTGHFSRLGLSVDNSQIISVDNDQGPVELNYLQTKKNNETQLLPLIVDITNPSPGIGWENKERKSFLERIHVDLVMALALIHHLCISDNLPFYLLSKLFAKMGRYLIIEFIPKEDSQVQRLLASRDDIFAKYSIEAFRSAFSEDFQIIDEVLVDQSQRTLFLLKRL